MKMRKRKAHFNRNYPVKTLRVNAKLAAFLNEMTSEMRQQFITRALFNYVEGNR